MVPVEVPPERLKTTVAPPVVRLFPAASRPVKVRVTVFPDDTLELETVSKDVVAEIEPGFTVTVGGVLVTGTPPMEALIVVGVPLIFPVKVAV